MNSPEKYEKAAGKEEEKERERHQLSNESEKTKLGSSTIFHFFSPEQKQSRHFSSLR